MSNNKVARNEEFSVQIFNKKYTKEKVELLVNQFENPKNPTDRRVFLISFFLGLNILKIYISFWLKETWLMS